jgi:hypothetical protein
MKSFHSQTEKRRQAARQQQREAGKERETQEAVETLRSWTSPRVGVFQYERSPVDWMKHTLQQSNDGNDDDDEVLPDASDDDYFEEALRPGRALPVRAFTTPRVLQRAETPVMSNSSRGSKGIMETPGTPPGVQSPVYVPTPASQLPQILARATPLSVSYVQECRAYHSALGVFRKDKQRLVARMDRSQESEAPTGGEEWARSVGRFTVQFTQDANRLDTDFLQSLRDSCYIRAAPLKDDPLQVNPMKDPARLEGNFWALLADLRSLGLEAIMWPADNEAQLTRRSEIAHFQNQWAQNVGATPLQLSQALRGPEAPLMVRRLLTIQRWLEQCHDRVLPSGTARSRHTKEVGFSGAFSATDRDDEILRAALNLLLAGRLDDAIVMASSSGLEHKAAQWSGGQPAGKVGNKKTGNTHRALWQTLMWKKAALQDQKTSNDESAVAALLSDHVKVALDNPSLRTWERAMYAFVRATVGRIEDEMLYRHNGHRRQERPSYPGTDILTYEEERVKATKAAHHMSETAIVQAVTAAPFDEMRNQSPFGTTMEAFCEGASTIEMYMKNWLAHLVGEEEDDDTDLLRFLAHLALYLDSLQALPDMTELKDTIVTRYLGHLASREELWHLLVLYASFLPAAVILQSLPPLLLNIESQQARQEIVSQMNESLGDFDREVLAEVARCSLEETDLAAEDGQTISVSDDKKMRVVLWFTLRSEFVPDGLIYANRLLRQFLLSGKVAAANHFIRDVCPAAIVEVVGEATPTGDVDASGNTTMDPEVMLLDDPLEESRAEHHALTTYLEAEAAVADWKAVLDTVPAVPPEIDDKLDKSRLNEKETAIALSTERRALAEEKRANCSQVTKAADKALLLLDGVLKYPGGWLLFEEEQATGGSFNTLKGQRRIELKELRSKLVPSMVVRYRHVCMETAAWMSESLDDGVQRLDQKRAKVVATLDVSTKAELSSLSPTFWTKRAVQIIDAVASDAYGCHSVLTLHDRKQILAGQSETMVAHLKYSSDFGWNHDF